MQCAVCSMQFAVCSVNYAVCSVQCALCNMQYAVCNVQCTVCTDHLNVTNLLTRKCPPNILFFVISFLSQLPALCGKIMWVKLQIFGFIWVNEVEFMEFCRNIGFPLIYALFGVKFIYLKLCLCKIFDI